MKKKLRCFEDWRSLHTISLKIIVMFLYSLMTGKSSWFSIPIKSFNCLIFSWNALETNVVSLLHKWLGLNHCIFWCSYSGGQLITNPQTFQVHYDPNSNSISSFSSWCATLFSVIDGCHFKLSQWSLYWDHWEVLAALRGYVVTIWCCRSSSLRCL